MNYGRGWRDSRRTHPNQQHRVPYWIQRFGAQSDGVQRVVDEVGPMVDATGRKYRGK